MSVATTLLSELESMGSFREAMPLSTPTLVIVEPEPEDITSGSGSYKAQSEASSARAQASFSVMERIVERLNSFSQGFQDLRDDFLELGKLWEPVEDIEPKISLSSPGDGFDESEFDDDNDLNTDDEETQDVQIR